MQKLENYYCLSSISPTESNKTRTVDPWPSSNAFLKHSAILKKIKLVLLIEGKNLILFTYISSAYKCSPEPFIMF